MFEELLQLACCITSDVKFAIHIDSRVQLCREDAAELHVVYESEGYKRIMEFCGCVVGSERVVNAWVLLLLLSRGRVRYSNPMGVV